MRVEEAIAIFERLGEPVRGKTSAQVPASRNRLLRIHHPDHGGSTQVTREINEAFLLVERGVPELVLKTKPAPLLFPIIIDGRINIRLLLTRRLMTVRLILSDGGVKVHLPLIGKWSTNVRKKKMQNWRKKPLRRQTDCVTIASIAPNKMGN